MFGFFFFTQIHTKHIQWIGTKKIIDNIYHLNCIHTREIYMIIVNNQSRYIQMYNISVKWLLGWLSFRHIFTMYLQFHQYNDTKNWYRLFNDVYNNILWILVKINSCWNFFSRHLQSISSSYYFLMIHIQDIPQYGDDYYYYYRI